MLYNNYKNINFVYNSRIILIAVEFSIYLETLINICNTFIKRERCI